MRKILLVAMMAFVVLSGCGKEETKEVSQSNVTYSYEEETLKALEKLSQSTVQQMDGDMESLKKKYSEWFDSNGDVCYPITPDSKKWQETDSKDELYELCEIPQEIVDVMSTELLLKAVESHPLYMPENYDFYPESINYMVEKSYAMSTLLRREDAYKVAASKYLARKLEVPQDESEAVELYNAVRLEEFLFSRGGAYNNMTDEERQNIVSAVKNNYEEEQQLKTVAGGDEYYFYDMIAYDDNPWKEYVSSFSLE